MLPYPFLDPVPAADPHPTVRRLATTDEVTPAAIDTSVSYRGAASSAYPPPAAVPFACQ
jgi:hypothetical protein